jgi:hypothetical protein
MRSLPRLLLFLVVSLVVAGLAGRLAVVPAHSAPKQPLRKQAPPKQAPQDEARFDGTWSVLVVTEAGTCDRAYRYSVQIVGGAVRYGGEAGVTLNGGVDGNGRVTVSLSFGQASAEGNGQLTGDAGKGTWSGRSSSSQCSGYWEAERRGQ